MAGDRLTRLRLPQLGFDLTELPLSAKAFIATAVLVLIGGIAAPSTISVAAILSTLPYFAILAVASIGQHLVIQQRELDLSTAGIMSFVAVVVTKLPDGSTDLGVVLFYVAAGLAVGAAIGVITGLIVTFFAGAAACYHHRRQRHSVRPDIFRLDRRVGSITDDDGQLFCRAVSLRADDGLGAVARGGRYSLRPHVHYDRTPIHCR